MSMAQQKIQQLENHIKAQKANKEMKIRTKQIKFAPCLLV